MRLLLDTNVVVSALMYGGSPGKLWNLAGSGAISLVTSEALVAELRQTLAKPKFADRLRVAKTTPETLTALYLDVAHLVVPPQVPRVVSADPADDAVLACAVAARAEAIVSGDIHLLALKEHLGIPIFTVSEALLWLGSSSSPH
jgi:putative PIN family toxin of toxin-antitoxin system